MVYMCCNIHHIALTLFRQYYHLFRSLQNYLNGKNFDDDNVKLHLGQLFANKSQNFLFTWKYVWHSLKDGKRSLSKMDSVLLNKVFLLYEKIIFYFVQKFLNYLAVKPMYVVYIKLNEYFSHSIGGKASLINIKYFVDYFSIQYVRCIKRFKSTTEFFGKLILMK